MSRTIIDLWHEFQNEVIWSAVTLALTVLAASARKLRRYVKNRHPYLRFWQLGRDGRFSIVPGSIIYSERQHVSSMSSGDVGALVEVTGTVRTLHPKSVVERLISVDFPADRLNTTIIGIGGPKNNQVVRQLLQDTDAGYTFEGVILKSERSGQTYRPEYGANGHPVIDYGLALKVPNPYEATEWFYAFAGCHTYGCLAAARLVSIFEPRALEYLRAVNKQAKQTTGTAVVVRARVVNNAVTKVTIAELVRLPQSLRRNALAEIHGTVNEGATSRRGDTAK